MAKVHVKMRFPLLGWDVLWIEIRTPLIEQKLF